MSDEEPKNHTKRLPASELPAQDETEAEPATPLSEETAHDTASPHKQLAPASAPSPYGHGEYASYPPPYGYGGYGSYPPPPYGYGGYMYTPPPQRPTNAMAVASMVVGIITLMSCQPLGIISIILGHIARRQIRDTGEDGDGFATAGIVTGWIGFAFSLLFILLMLLIFIIPFILIGAG